MEYNVLDFNKKYVIGVSGGPDSMYLLDSIYNYSGLIKNNFIVCVINYQKRDDSNIDEEIVIKYCQTKNFEYYVKKIEEDDYQKYQQFSHNFQSVAREIRYDFFLKIAEEKKCVGVLIAHNVTDNIETYILQKNRNAIVEHYGLNEKSWYYSKIYDAKIEVFRIMLKISRQEIMEYLFDHKVNYAIDYTNILGIYNRNIIRNEIQQFNLNDLLTEIQQKNIENKILKNKAKNYLIDNFGQINCQTFKILESNVLKKIVLFQYFKNNNLINLIANKKKKFLDEVLKELTSPKPNIIIKINSEYNLVKSYENVELVLTDILKNLTVIITKTSLLPIEWKKISFLVGTKLNYSFKVSDEQFPLYVTNDPLFFKQTKLNQKKMTRWFIENKISILARKNYFIFDQNFNLIWKNELVHPNIDKYIYNSLIDKGNLNYFVIK